MYLHVSSITQLPDVVATRVTHVRVQHDLRNNSTQESSFYDFTFESYYVYMDPQRPPPTPAYFAYNFWTRRPTSKFQVCTCAQDQDLQFDTSLKAVRLKAEKLFTNFWGTPFPQSDPEEIYTAARQCQDVSINRFSLKSPYRQQSYSSIKSSLFGGKESRDAKVTKNSNK